MSKTQNKTDKKHQNQQTHTESKIKDNYKNQKILKISNKNKKEIKNWNEKTFKLNVKYYRKVRKEILAKNQNIQNRMKVFEQPMETMNILQWKQKWKHVVNFWTDENENSMKTIDWLLEPKWSISDRWTNDDETNDSTNKKHHTWSTWWWQWRKSCLQHPNWLIDRVPADDNISGDVQWKLMTVNEWRMERRTNGKNDR